MNIAIVHYHIKPGGVTRVIENTIKALSPREDVKIVVLSGEDYEGLSSLNVRTVPGLRYAYTADDAPDPEALAANMLAAARDGLEGGEPDLFHVHNHALGKNIAFPYALSELVQEGRKVLLQLHDFAEDGRPSNYARLKQDYFNLGEQELARICYPLGEAIQYAVLNARDYRFLKEAGCPDNQLHILPNPTEASLTQKDDKTELFPEAKRFILYPVRGIRRKNLGELLLLAACSPADWHYGTTLPPENPEWHEIYTRWKTFSQECRLPVSFELGKNPDHRFEDWVARADALISTSVAEGFGLAFLEPYAFGKGLLGRDLPEITRDFKASGLKLDHLYQSIEVPHSWIDMEQFQNKLEGALDSYYAAYGRTLPADAVENHIQHNGKSGFIDFACLDEDLQMAVIDQVRDDPGKAKFLFPDPFNEWPEAETVMENKSIVDREYSLEGYRTRLETIYERLMEAPGNAPEDSLNPSSLLSAFLDPARFRLLRS